MYQQILSGNQKNKELIHLPAEIPLEPCRRSSKTKHSSNETITGDIKKSDKDKDNEITIIEEQRLVKLINKDTSFVRLGFGGFGDVFLGSLDDGQKVAVKLTELSKRSKLSFAKREARLLSRFSNKNILKFYGCYRDNWNYYLVTEYCAQGVSNCHLMTDFSLNSTELLTRPNVFCFFGIL